MAGKIFGGMLGALAHSGDHGHFGGGQGHNGGAEGFPPRVPPTMSGFAPLFAASSPGIPAEPLMEQMPPGIPAEQLMKQMSGFSSDLFTKQMPPGIAAGPLMKQMPDIPPEPFMEHMPHIPGYGGGPMPREFVSSMPARLDPPLQQGMPGAHLKAKCEFLEEAKQKGGPKLMLLKTMGWFEAMQHKCAAMAEGKGSARFEPSAPPEMPHFKQSHGAWNWQAAAGGLRQNLGDERGQPQMPDMQQVMAAKMGETVMHQKCHWLEQQVKQLAMAEHGAGVYAEDEGTKKLRHIASWAQKQPWFGMLRATCDELAAAAAQTAIHV